MKSLKKIGIWFAAFAMFFTSLISQAGMDVNVRRAVSYLNYEANLESLITKYKGHFTSKADQKYLDQLLSKHKETTDKWLWRFEVRSEDKVALRINGRVQAILSEIDPVARTFKVNGAPIAWTDGQSFESFYNSLTNAVSKKAAQHPLEALFFERAHAILPLIVGLVAGGALIMANEQAQAHQPQCEYTASAVTAQSSSGSRSVLANELQPYRNNFRGGRLCQGMPRDFRRRMELVRPNFRDNGMFNTRTNTRHQYDENCVTRYSERMGGRPRAVQICKCIHRKMSICDQGGWNMQEPMATSTCFTAFNGCRVVDRPTPQPQPHYPPPVTDTPTPDVDCDKPSGQCSEPEPQTPYTPNYDTPTPEYDQNKTDSAR